MSATLAEMTAAPLEIPIKVKDSQGVEHEKIYRMAPLTQADFGEFELWMQTRYVDRVKEMTKDLTPEERSTQIKYALERSVELTVTSNEGVRIINTLDGMKHLVYISLRREHPAIDLEEVGRLMMSADVAKHLLEKIDWINGGRTPLNPPLAPMLKLQRGRRPVNKRPSGKAKRRT